MEEQKKIKFLETFDLKPFLKNVSNIYFQNNFIEFDENKQLGTFMLSYYYKKNKIKLSLNYNNSPFEIKYKISEFNLRTETAAISAVSLMM